MPQSVTQRLLLVPVMFALRGPEGCSAGSRRGFCGVATGALRGRDGCSAGSRRVLCGVATGALHDHDRPTAWSRLALCAVTTETSGTVATSVLRSRQRSSAS